MTAACSFEIIYAPIVRNHLRVIEPKYYSLIRETIEAQLQFEPDKETKNRKPLKRPIALGADWEIRFGPENRFRVFYKADHQTNRVEILAIGTKRGNILHVGGEEFEI